MKHTGHRCGTSPSYKSSSSFCVTIEVKEPKYRKRKIFFVKFFLHFDLIDVNIYTILENAYSDVSVHLLISSLYITKVIQEG